ncbi:MAG: GntR family transcriptional regulator [Acidimicrobiales bacterium]
MAVAIPAAASARSGQRSRPQLSDEVANHIRELIVSGQLRPGDFIRQDRIAEELDLSGTPVREGLMALRGEGFVLLLPRRGFVVAPLSGKDIHDLFTAQALLAGELVARATGRIDEQGRDELGRIDAAINLAAAAADVDEVERLNHAFHRLVNLAADSPKLSWMLSVSVRFAPRRFYATIPGWAEASARDHASILAAVRAGDAEAARAAMHRHIEHAGRLLAAHFDDPARSSP